MLIKLSKSLKKNGLVSILTLPPMRGNDITSKEFFALVEAFDKINVMTYDFSPSNPGPNSPLPWISETFAKLLQGNEADYGKILLGIPFYGYDYKDGQGKPVVGKEFIDIIQKSAKDVWDEQGKEHKFIYSNQGKQCVVYFPTLEMIKERLDFALNHGMGIGIWELGQGLEHFFNLL